LSSTSPPGIGASPEATLADDVAPSAGARRADGGFSTKINARTNAEGLPIGVVITPGQAHDVTAFPALMQEIDSDPEQMLGDKGYDSEAVRNDIEERGGEAAIPSTATRKVQHAVDKALYALRNRIERFFNRAKNSRRVATRSDKLMESFAAFVLLCLHPNLDQVCPHNLALQL
jgi:transposase